MCVHTVVLFVCECGPIVLSTFTNVYQSYSIPAHTGTVINFRIIIVRHVNQLFDILEVVFVLSLESLIQWAIPLAAC